MQPSTNPQPPPPAPIPTNPTGPPVSPLPSSPAPMQPQQPPAANTQTGFFSGRLNRMGYFLSIVYLSIYFLIPVILALTLRGKVAGNIIMILVGLVGVVAAIPIGISVGVRRWHDLNQTGWLILLGLVPFLGFILLVINLFVPGTKGPNKYGEPDTRPSSPRKVLLNK